MPERIQLRRTKGWRMPENTVRVCRPGIFGNPWLVKQAMEAGYSPDDAHAMAAEWFHEWLISPATDDVTHHSGLGGYAAEHARIHNALPTLRGKNLACFCRIDQACHADVLLKLANAN